ncbi:hypothetical protein MRM75_12135 [bacterium 19CA06SA08-2]|uniref:Uncharacterized protein n=1 Tax=bacterium 19CA06SA08-2 TaxID=2920658 RepID=A0AAU6U0K4_UNCXX
MKRLNALPILLFLFSAIASAFSLSSLIKQAEVIKANAVVSASSTAIKVSTTIRGFAANDPYFIKNIDVPKTTFMGHVKGNISSLAKRNAWYAAWLGTMAAAGWAIDELHNQVTTNKIDFKGDCKSQYGTHGTDLTTEQCAKAFVSALGATYVGYSKKFSYQQPAIGNSVYYYAQYKTGGMSGSQEFYVAYKVSSSTSEPVSDDALYDSLITYMLQDKENAAQAFMVPDAYPYPYPQVFPDTVPYIPGVAESDQEALDWYYKGLLQSTNPNAPYYVSPERYQQIASLANQLQQGQTPEGQVSAANSTLKNPLTQKELEETLKKRDIDAKKEAEEISKTDTKPVTDAYKDSKLKEEYDKLKERITDPSKMPQLPPLPAQAQIDLPTYRQCQTVTMNFFNGVLTFPNPDQCQKLEQVKTGLGYLMYVLTALGLIMELFRRVE